MDEEIKDFVNGKYNMYDINPALSFTIKNAFHRTYKPETIEIIADLANDIRWYQYNNNIVSSPICNHESEYIQQESQKEEDELEEKIRRCVFPNTHWFITNNGIHYYHHKYLIKRSDDSDSFDAFFALQWSCYSLYEMSNFLEYHQEKHEIKNYSFYLKMLLIKYEDFFENYDSVQKMLDLFLKNLKNSSIKNNDNFNEVQVIKEKLKPIVLFELDVLLEILLPFFPNEKDDNRLRNAFYNKDLSSPLYFSGSAVTIGYLFIQLRKLDAINLKQKEIAVWLSKYISYTSAKEKIVVSFSERYARDCINSNKKAPKAIINLDRYMKST